MPFTSTHRQSCLGPWTGLPSKQICDLIAWVISRDQEKWGRDRFYKLTKVVKTFILKHFYDDSQGPALNWIRIFLLTSVQYELSILHCEIQNIIFFISSNQSSCYPKLYWNQFLSWMTADSNILSNIFLQNIFPSHAILTTIVAADRKMLFIVSCLLFLSSVALFITTLTSV